MSENTKIEWCDHTFNPWEGCQKVGPGCDNCYAETRNARFGGGQAINWGPGAPRRRTSDANWRKPMTWAKQPYWQCPCGWRGIERDMVSWDDSFGAWAACPHCHLGQFSRTRARVFCASLADVFDNAVPPEWRLDLFKLIAATPDLDWLLLTKRIGNVAGMLGDYKTVPLAPNIWIGASITSREEMLRDAPKLKDVDARVRFWSVEPMLGDLGCIQRELLPEWVIVGGESGHGARPMHPDWARSLRDQCAAAGVPFLFKQWGNWRAAVWFDGPDADVDEGDDFIDLDRVNHQFLAADGRTWDTNGGRHMYPPLPLGHWCLMVAEGKKACGRLLDDIEHNGFPEVPR